MTRHELPPEGAVLVLTDAPGEWGAAVADRNAAGHRTALLVVAVGTEDPADLAKHMAEDIFRGAPWTLIDARPGMSAPT